jgi:hypothetical protein
MTTWQCMQTGDCCRSVEAITVTGAELDAMRAAKDVPLKVQALGNGFVRIEAAPCPFLDGTKCAIYASRPLNCRRYICGRDNADAFVDFTQPIPVQVLQSRDLRRQYALNQRRAMATWGHRMGWADDGR